MESLIEISPEPAKGATGESEQQHSRRLLTRVASGEVPFALRIWKPVPVLALSRLDELRPGADAARAAARRAGLEAVTRVSGGHAVVLGEGSFCVGFAEPATTFEGTQARYERLSAALIDAFAKLGIEAEHGELDGEWCPGTWSIRSGGVKLAGLAQRAIKGGAWAEAVVELAPDQRARDLLREVYAALDLPLDPQTLGSVSELTGELTGFGELADSLLPALQT